MKKHLTIIILFCTVFLHAQFAIVQDKDGFVNVRNEGKIANNIIDKLKSGTIVYALEPASANWDWTTIIYSGEKTGVVSWNRLNFIGNFSALRREETQDELVIDNRFFVIDIKTQKFSPKKNKLTKQDGIITEINGKNFWGSDGMMPETEYKSIEIMQGNKEIVVPKTEYENLYSPDLSRTFAYFDKITKRLYITAENSDGAGSYALVFVFQDGKFIEKQLIIPF